MGYFKKDINFNRLDWILLQNSNLNLYHDNSIINSDIEWLRSNNYKIIEFECHKWNTKQDIDNDFLRFGTPYDNCSNLDALKDCIIELNFPDMSDAVLILRGFDNLIRITDKDYAEGFLDVIATEARRYLLFGVRLIVLVSTKEHIEFYSKFGGMPFIKRD